MATPAVTAVFGTAELLELILLQVDQSDLLIRAQLVCRRWKFTIDESAGLQQKLFFQGARPNQITKPTLNPLLQKLFPEFFSAVEQPNKLDYREWAYGRKHRSARHMRMQPWFLDESRRKTVLRRNASWRRMFPVQPPTKIQRVYIVESYPCIYARFQQAVEIEPAFHRAQRNGASMGLLYDLAMQMLDFDYCKTDTWANQNKNRFQIRWNNFTEKEHYEGGMTADQEAEQIAGGDGSDEEDNLSEMSNFEFPERKDEEEDVSNPDDYNGEDEENKEQNEDQSGIETRDDDENTGEDESRQDDGNGNDTADNWGLPGDIQSSSEPDDWGVADSLIIEGNDLDVEENDLDTPVDEKQGEDITLLKPLQDGIEIWMYNRILCCGPERPGPYQPTGLVIAKCPELRTPGDRVWEWEPSWKGWKQTCMGWKVI